MLYQILGIGILLAFYSIYLGKMLLQRQKGIQTDHIAKGTKKGNLMTVEVLMKIATYSVLGVELISIAFNSAQLHWGARLIGFCIGVVGVIIFGISVYTMKDNWRAGIPQEAQTSMVTEGIYSVSRNPAFLGFDLAYIGILLMFFNWVLLAFTVFAIILLHLQILQEEAYLPTVFGEEYTAYHKRVKRYIGRYI